MINETKELKYKFTNALMFAIVMRDEQLCTGLLQRIIPERKISQVRFPDSPLVNVKYLETEKTLIPDANAKSVRLDVLFEDESAWYVLEMQVIDTGEIPKRSRYYHSASDVRTLGSGRRYSELKPCYVIFICMFDLFGLEEPIYRFQMTHGKNRLPLGDEQYTLILNADCPPEHCTEDLRAFYAYLKDGVIDEKDDLIREIHHQVEHANQEEGVLHFMTLQEELDIRDLIIEKKDKEAKEANVKAEAANAKAEAANAKAEAARAEAEEAKAEAKNAKAEVEAANAKADTAKAEAEEAKAEAEKLRRKLKEAEEKLRQNMG